MARGTQFLSLITMLRSELGRSDNVAIGVADIPELKQKLNRVYEQAYADYDWPHLNVHHTAIPMLAGERYYDVPTTLDFDRVEEVYVWLDGRARPLKRGITVEDYNAFSSPDDERSSQIMKWDIRFTGTTEQVEVWPMPSADDTQTLQFVGMQKFARLVNNSDTCKLDDSLIVLLAAAAVSKDKDEQQKFLGQANERLVTLKANARSGERDIRLNLGAEEPDPYKGVTITVS
jgi:hypothetical protein